MKLSYLLYRQNRNSILRRAIVYIVLSVIVLSSLLAAQAATLYQEQVIGSIDYYLALTSEETSGARRAILKDNGASPLHNDDASELFRFSQELEEQFPYIYANSYVNTDATMPVFVGDIEEGRLTLFAPSGNINSAANYDAEIRHFQEEAQPGIWSQFRGCEREDHLDVLFQIVITKGRSITTQEIERNDPVCVIPETYRLSDRDHILDPQPGDHLIVHLMDITDPYHCQSIDSYDLEIVGEYRTVNRVGGFDSFVEYDAAVKAGNGMPIYVPQQFVFDLQRSIEERELHNPYYSSSRQTLHYYSTIFHCSSLQELNELVSFIESSIAYQEGKVFYSATTKDYAEYIAAVFSFSENIRLLSVLSGLVAFSSVLLILFNAAWDSMRMVFQYSSLGLKKEKVCRLLTCLEGAVMMISILLSVIPAFIMTNTFAKQVFLDMQSSDFAHSFPYAHPADLAFRAEDMRLYGQAWIYLPVLIIAAAVCLLSFYIFLRCRTVQNDYRSILNETD